MKEAYERAKAGRAGPGRLRPLVCRVRRQGPNNASLASVALYTAQVPAFRALLREAGGDLPRFYARVKEIAAMRRPQRDDVLAQATRVPRRRIARSLTRKGPLPSTLLPALRAAPKGRFSRRVRSQKTQQILDR